MLIGAVAQRTGLSVKALRYYEHVGVLDVAQRTPGGYRTYDESVLERITFVRSAQAVGLTLGEIREIIAFRERGENPCAHVLGVLADHAAELERRIRELQQLRHDLYALAARAGALDPSDCAATTVCHIIAGP